MKRFEYDITVHAAEAFREVAYFCTEEGECNLGDVPGDQVGMLTGLLNVRGMEGWELVQISFRKSGIMAFWKRESAG